MYSVLIIDVTSPEEVVLLQRSTRELVKQIFSLFSPFSLRTLGHSSYHYNNITSKKPRFIPKFHKTKLQSYKETLDGRFYTLSLLEFKFRTETVTRTWAIKEKVALKKKLEHSDILKRS